MEQSSRCGVIRRNHQGAFMPINRNILLATVGALCVVVAILGYKVYEDNREPKGVQLNIGPAGISVEKK